MSQQDNVYCWLERVEPPNICDRTTAQSPLSKPQPRGGYGSGRTCNPSRGQSKCDTRGERGELRLRERGTCRIHVDATGAWSHHNSFHADHSPYFLEDPVSTGEYSASGQNAVAHPIGKTYERKPRRKTRECRYEPKEAATRVPDMSKDERCGCEAKPRKKKRKSGKTKPEDTFKAPNVLQERLTVKPVVNKALFRRGRASASTKRSNLPDLTFSEMGFLSKTSDRSCEPTLTTEAPTNKRNSPGTASIEEISRYFSKAHEQQSEKDMTDNPVTRTEQVDIPECKRTYQTKSSNSQFAAHISNQQHQSQWAHIADRFTSRHMRAASSTECAKAASVSTSYYTWSASNARGNRSPLAQPRSLRDANPSPAINSQKPTNRGCQAVATLAAFDHSHSNPTLGAYVTDMAINEGGRNVSMSNEIKKHPGNMRDDTQSYYKGQASGLENDKASIAVAQAGTDALPRVSNKPHGIRVCDQGENTVGTQTSESMFQHRDDLMCNGEELTDKEIDTLCLEGRGTTQYNNSEFRTRLLNIDDKNGGQGVAVKGSSYVRPEQDLESLDMDQHIGLIHASSPACSSSYIPHSSTPNTLSCDMSAIVMQPDFGIQETQVDLGTPREMTRWLPFGSRPKSQGLESGQRSTRRVVQSSSVNPAKRLAAWPKFRPDIPDFERNDLSAPQWRQFSVMDCEINSKHLGWANGPHSCLTSGATGCTNLSSSHPSAHISAGQTSSGEVESFKAVQSEGLVPRLTTFWRPNKLY